MIMIFSDGTPIAVPTDLEASGAYISSQAGAIADELAALAQQLQPLEGTWTGRAAGYYEGLQQEWNLAAAGLFAPEGVLGQIANAMNVAWVNYSDAENSNVQTWTSS
jgi:WXG100 family type VII secretion target